MTTPIIDQVLEGIEKRCTHCNEPEAVEFYSVDKLLAALRVALEALAFYADKDGECWAACRPDDTAETCCHMIAEESGGKQARSALSEITALLNPNAGEVEGE